MSAGGGSSSASSSDEGGSTDCVKRSRMPIREARERSKSFARKVTDAAGDVRANTVRTSVPHPRSSYMYKY